MVSQEDTVSTCTKETSLQVHRIDKRKLQRQCYKLYELLYKNKDKKVKIIRMMCSGVVCPL